MSECAAREVLTEQVPAIVWWCEKYLSFHHGTESIDKVSIM